MSKELKELIRNRIVGFKMKSADDLVFNPKNYRKHPKRQQEALSASLRELGWIGVVVENVRTGRLIDGHERVWQARKSGSEVPVLQVDLSEDEEKLALAIFDPISAMAETDVAILDELLKEVNTGEASLQALIDNLAKEAGLYVEKKADAEPGVDKVAELREKWGTNVGDLWILGDHRLVCGDSTDPETVRRLMNGERAVLFATDPPYLVDYDGKNHPHKWNEPDKNKDWSEEYRDWDKAVDGDGLYDGFVKMAVEHAILPNAAWYCWHASRNQRMVENIWEKYGAFVHQQIVWVKDRAVLTRGWYMWQHEPCFFGWIKGNKPPRRAEDYPHTVWNINTIRPGETTLHPTSKPLEVFSIPMQQHTVRGEICYEPFCGSGSQVIAAENLGRRCFALELEPGFVAVTLQRFFDVSGKMPVKT